MYYLIEPYNCDVYFDELFIINFGEHSVVIKKLFLRMPIKKL